MYSVQSRRFIDRELEAANQALQQGLEGRSRVCARRAAGAAAREFLSRQSILLPAPDAHSILVFLATLPHIPPPAVQAAQRLTQRVDQQFHLPPDVSLIVEAKILIDELEQLL
jgi:hypothetical protein